MAEDELRGNAAPEPLVDQSKASNSCQNPRDASLPTGT